MSASSTAPNRSPDNLVDQAQAAHQPTKQELVLSRITPINLESLSASIPGSASSSDPSMASPPLKDQLILLKEAQIPPSAANLFKSCAELVAAYGAHFEHTEKAVNKLGLHGFTIEDFIDASILDSECRHLFETNLRTQCAIFNQDPRSSKFFPCEQEHLLGLKVAAQTLDRPSEDSGEAHIQKAYDKLAQLTQDSAIEHLRTAENSPAFSATSMMNYVLAVISKVMQSLLPFNRAEETLDQNATPSINRIVDQVLNDNHPHPEPARIFLNAMAATGQISEAFPGLEGLKILHQLSAKLDRREVGLFAKAYDYHLSNLSDDEINQGLSDDQIHSDIHADLRTLQHTHQLLSAGTISSDEVLQAIKILKTPIGQFTLTGNPVKALEAVNADINSDLGAGFNALHLAAITGDTQLLTKAIEHFGESQLDLKTQKNNFLDRVLRIGTAPAANSDTALTISAYMGKDAVAQSLIEKGADITHKNGTGNTPLHLAAGRCPAVLEVLFSALKDKGVLQEAINCQTHPGKSTPLHHAAKAAKSSTDQLAVTLLLRELIEDATSSLDQADAGGDTPRSILREKNISVEASPSKS